MHAHLSNIHWWRDIGIYPNNELKNAGYWKKCNNDNTWLNKILWWIHFSMLWSLFILSPFPPPVILVLKVKTSASSSESDWNTGTGSTVNMSTILSSASSSSFNESTAPSSSSTISNSSSHSKYSTFLGRAWKSGANAMCFQNIQEYVWS